MPFLPRHANIGYRYWSLLFATITLSTRYCHCRTTAAIFRYVYMLRARYARVESLCIEAMLMLSNTLLPYVVYYRHEYIRARRYAACAIYVIMLSPH